MGAGLMFFPGVVGCGHTLDSLITVPETSNVDFSLSLSCLCRAGFKPHTWTRTSGSGEETRAAYLWLQNFQTMRNSPPENNVSGCQAFAGSKWKQSDSLTHCRRHLKHLVCACAYHQTLPLLHSIMYRNFAIWPALL